MSNGVYLSPRAIRIGLSACALAIAAVLALQLPEIVRYLKSETM